MTTPPDALVIPLLEIECNLVSNAVLMARDAARTEDEAKMLHCALRISFESARILRMILGRYDETAIETLRLSLLKLTLVDANLREVEHPFAGEARQRLQIHMAKLQGLIDELTKPFGEAEPRA